MSIDIIFEIFLWLLVVVSFVSGVSMTTLLVRDKHKKGNHKQNELWLHRIMKFFWIFLGFMAIIGFVLGMLAF